MDVMYLPFLWMMAWPYLALLPAGLFYFLFRKTSSPAIFLALCAWVVYGFYELTMREWSKTVITPIRIDLFLIAPVLTIISGLGLAVFLMRKHKMKS